MIVIEKPAATFNDAICCGNPIGKLFSLFAGPLELHGVNIFPFDSFSVAK